MVQANKRHPLDKEQFETRLREEVKRARTSYEAITAEYKRALTSCEENRVAIENGNRFLGPRASVAQATQLQHRASVEYKRLVQACNIYVLYKEAPKDSEPDNGQPTSASPSSRSSVPPMLWIIIAVLSALIALVPGLTQAVKALLAVR